MKAQVSHYYLDDLYPYVEQAIEQYKEGKISPRRKIYIVVFEWWELPGEASGYHNVAAFETERDAKVYAYSCTEIAKELLRRSHVLGILAIVGQLETDKKVWDWKDNQYKWVWDWIYAQRDWLCKHPLDPKFDPSIIGIPPYANDWGYFVEEIPYMSQTDDADPSLPPFELCSNNAATAPLVDVFEILYKPLEEKLGVAKAIQALKTLEDKWDGGKSTDLIELAKQIAQEFLEEQ